MVTPVSPTIAETPQGIQQLRAELQQAKALFNNVGTLFVIRSLDLSGSVVTVDGDDFADSVAGDLSLYSPIGCTAATVKKDVDLSRAGYTRTKKYYGFVPAINLTIVNTKLDFYLQVEGFDHPAMRNPHHSCKD